MPDIGPTSQAASVQLVDSDPGGHWYEIDCVISHSGRPGPNQKMLVRWKGFQDVSDDSWIPRKHVTPLALEAYERFLTEYAKDLLISFISLYLQALSSLTPFAIEDNQRCGGGL